MYSSTFCVLTSVNQSTDSSAPLVVLDAPATYMTLVYFRPPPHLSHPEVCLYGILTFLYDGVHRSLSTGRLDVFGFPLQTTSTFTVKGNLLRDGKIRIKYKKKITLSLRE
jgi:hypothetical protein